MLIINAMIEKTERNKHCGLLIVKEFDVFESFVR